VSLTRSPRRTPLACGALGHYDGALVREIGGRLAGELSVVHADEGSILLLDRPAIRWRARGRQGFAWSESPVPRRPVASWREAACDLSACGLVAGRHRWRVHSSVSGVAPIYHLEHQGAVYFASRIDPLVQALARRYTIDWRAWASIFYLRFPLGERTPFLEVKRLRPFSTLEWDHVRNRLSARQHRWPWATVEPIHDLQQGAAAVVQAMRAALAPLAGEPTVCTLSGGWDSRLLLCLLAEQGGEGVRAVTVSKDNGHYRDEVLAAEVAARLGIPHSTLEGRPVDFWRDTRQRAFRADYQLAAPPWAMPLVEGLRDQPGAVTDGLALDTLAQGGTHYYAESMLDPDGSPTIARELWKRLLGKTMRHAVRRTLSRDLDRTLKPLAKRQFMRESDRFRGHPVEMVLTFYATRTVRGISLTPHAILGGDLFTVTPFTDHGVALACLATRPREKFHARIYEAMFDLVHPQVGALRSTHDRLPAPAVTRARRGLEPEAVKGYESVLANGPLTRLLSPELRRHLADHTLGVALDDPALHRGVLAVSLLHLWHERYRDRLAGGELLEGLELASPGRAPRREVASAGSATHG
jgi:asparagine synthase